MSGGFIPPHGGYKKLLSYEKAEIVYDATVHFCDRFIDRRSRTHDQMIQAARSGKQNIVEGSMASGTSKETEIKLTNVARASLEELLADYCDFSRVRKLAIWDKDDPRAQAVRRMGYGTEGTHGTHGSHVTYATYASHVEQSDPETAANTIICLIHQASYLLDQQLRALETAFVKEGGLRERMTCARLAERKKKRMP
jgi:four helix bundle suffix protein